MRAASQFALVNSPLDDSHSLSSEIVPVAAAGVRAANAEPLMCYRVAIFKTRVADIA